MSSGYTSPDWTIRAAHWDVRLTSARPFDARWLRHPRPTSIRVSIHDGMEAGIILTGGAQVHLEDRVILGRPGDACLIGMWEPHRWRITQPGTQQIAVVFLPEFIGEDVLRSSAWMTLFTCEASERPLVRTREMRQTVLRIGRELQREIERREPGWQTAVRLAVTRLLFTLSRRWECPSRASRTRGVRPLRVARIMPALEAVHARPAERVTMAQAAAACRLSPTQFNRVFRRAMGVSFARFRLRSHLAFAAQLLRTTQMSTDAIAAQAGFADASHLHRNFARHYGKTPGAYREHGE